ncbi:glycosyltransferase [Bacillus sp. FDAARGOS_1420]|uniref:glycosyltransferase n=1 Tax=unclassified Bacillus (in: firmicutes) TaxID=185979 RepID=UPI001C5B31BF|nr:glycosyltransferase [Bacillus sp. FDAARGOS_1420]MBW3491680.1 glycosyltransferase [Bacillus sp. FDAARGOS_1420]
MKTNKKLLILSNYFPPQVEIAAIRIKSIIKYLNKLDWEVFCLNTVEESKGYQGQGVKSENIIVSENYLHKLRKNFKKENSNFLSTVEEKKNDQISLTSKLKIYIKLAYQTVALFLWVISSYIKVRKKIKQNKIGSILCTVPSIDMLVLGAFIKKRHPEIELIEEIRDVIFCNQIYKKELTDLEQRFYYYLEKNCVKRVEKFVFLTENIKKNYVEEFNIDTPHVVITNGFDEEIYTDIEYSKKEKCVISHFGSFYGSRNPIEFIKAVGELINKEKFDIHVNLVGKFQDKNIEKQAIGLIEEFNLVNNFTIISSLEHEKVILLEQTSDLNLIITHTNGESNYALPGKVFEYIGAQRPIFCISSDSLLCDMIHEYKLGYLVKSNEEACIVKELKRIYEDWDSNNLDTSFNKNGFGKFSRRELTKKLNDFLIL